MCDAPSVPAAQDPDRVEFLRNPYLDGAVGRSSTVQQLRTGRSALRIDLGSGVDSGLGIAPPTTVPSTTGNAPGLAPWRQPGGILPQPTQGRPVGAPTRPGEPLPSFGGPGRYIP